VLIAIDYDKFGVYPMLSESLMKLFALMHGYSGVSVRMNNESGRGLIVHIEEW
jgi:hypothetical protein